MVTLSWLVYSKHYVSSSIFFLYLPRDWCTDKVMGNHPDHPPILVMNEYFFKKLRFVIISRVLQFIDIPIPVLKVQTLQHPGPKKRHQQAQNTTSTSLSMATLWLQSTGTSMNFFLTMFYFSSPLPLQVSLDSCGDHQSSKCLGLYW